MEALQAGAQHRPVDLAQQPARDVDDPAGVNAEQDAVDGFSGEYKPFRTRVFVQRHPKMPRRRAKLSSCRLLELLHLGCGFLLTLRGRRRGPASRSRRLGFARQATPTTQRVVSRFSGSLLRGVRRRLTTQGARAGSAESTLGRGGRLRVSRGGGGLPIGRCRSSLRLAAIPAALLEIVLERRQLALESVERLLERSPVRPRRSARAGRRRR